MKTIGLKSNLHKLVDQIDDERLLRSIYSFIKQRENTEEGRIWNSLTEDQKKEVMLAYDESEDDGNLIEYKEVWKKLK